MPSITIRLATPADDKALRCLLRENPIPGVLSLSFEREPDYFIATASEGVFSQTIIGIDNETGECLGMGTRVIRPMFLNGVVQAVGYMSHLRMDLHYAWGMSLARWVVRAFQNFRELHADGGGRLVQGRPGRVDEHPDLPGRQRRRGAAHARTADPVRHFACRGARPVGRPQERDPRDRPPDR